MKQTAGKKDHSRVLSDDSWDDASLAQEAKNANILSEPHEPKQAIGSPYQQNRFASAASTAKP